MPDERFRIIFEGQERNLDQVLKRLEAVFDRLSKSDPFDGINKALKAVQASMESLPGAIASGFATVQKSVEMLSGTLEKIPVEQAEKLSKGMKNVADATKENVFNIGKLSGALMAMGGVASRAFSTIGDNVRKLHEGIGAAIGQTFSSIGDKLGGLSSGAVSGNIFSPLIEGARKALTTVLDGANALTQGVVSAARTAITTLRDLWGELQKGMATAVGAGIGALAMLIPGVGQVAMLVGTMLGNAVGAALKAANDIQTGVLNAALSIAGGLADAVTGALQGAINVASSILNSLITVVQGVVEKVGQAFAAIVGRVAGIAGEIVSKFTLAFTGVAGVAAAQSIKFRDQMAVTFGLIAEDGTTTFQELTARVRDVMSETPFISWTEGAKGLFAAISAGITDPEKAIDALKASIDLALGGGMRELGTAMEAVSRIMYNFGLSGKDAADAVYAIQKAAQLEVTDVAQGIGKVIAPAKAAGAALEDIGAAIALVSKTLPAEEAFTAVARMFSSLSGPAGSAASAFEGKDIKLRDAEKNLRPITEILDQLRAANLKDFELSAMFPNERALKAVQLLLQQTSEEFEKLKKVTAERSGMAAQAASVVRDRLGAQLSSTWGAWEGLIDRVIERIEGPLVNALKSLQGYVKGLASSPGFNDVADQIGRAAVAAVDFVERGLRYVVASWPAIEAAATTAVKGIEKAWAGLKGAVQTTYDLIRGWVSESPESGLIKVWEEVKEKASGALDILKEYSEGNVEPLKLKMEELWSYFTDLAKAAWGKVGTFALESIAWAMEKAGPLLERFLLVEGSELMSAAKLAGVQTPNIPNEERKASLYSKQAAGEDLIQLLNRYQGETISDVINAAARDRTTNIFDASHFAGNAWDKAKKFGLGPSYPQNQTPPREALETIQKANAEVKAELVKFSTMFTDLARDLREAGEDLEAWRKSIEQAGEDRRSGLRSAFERSKGEGDPMYWIGPPAGALGGQPPGPGGPAQNLPVSSVDIFGQVFRALQTAADDSSSAQKWLDGREKVGRHPEAAWQPRYFPGSPRAISGSGGGGFGGGPAGTTVDAIRENEKRVDELRRMRSEILQGLDAAVRERALSMLPERYSLKDLQGVIPEAGDISKRLGGLDSGVRDEALSRLRPGFSKSDLDSVMQEIEAEQRGDIPVPSAEDSWWGSDARKKKRQQGGTVSGEPRNAEQFFGGLKSAAEMENEQGDAQLASLEEQLKKIQDMKEKTQQTGDMSLKVMDKISEAYEQSIEYLQAQIKELQRKLDQMERRSTKARDMTS